MEISKQSKDVTVQHIYVDHLDNFRNSGSKNDCHRKSKPNTVLLNESAY